MLNRGATAGNGAGLQQVPVTRVASRDHGFMSWVIDGRIGGPSWGQIRRIAGDARCAIFSAVRHMSRVNGESGVCPVGSCE
jgi:hypothetical protein